MSDRSPEQIRKELFDTLERINQTNGEITGLINVFPDYYEQMQSLLSVVSKANELSNRLQDAVADLRETGAGADDPDFDAQMARILRTQEWAKKNHELAQAALQRLSDLEDVTLQFYDNPHPDVVID